MRIHRSTLVWSLFALSAVAWAAPPERVHGRGRPNYDARGGKAVRDRAAALAANPSPALSALEASLGTKGVLSIDGVTGTPRRGIAARALLPEIAQIDSPDFHVTRRNQVSVVRIRGHH